MRLEEASAVVRESYPAEYVDLVLAVTELGGTTVPLVLLAVLFWLASRRRTALAISYAVAGVGFVLALKALFGLSRPPAEVAVAAVELESDSGFPSGHAFAAVVVYGGLLSAYDRTRDPRALLAVATVVVLVSLSRVVLGVHYLGDVIVGAALGVAFLAAMSRLTRGDPTIGFGIALVLAVPAVALTGAGEDALLGLGSSIGGLLATRRLDRFPALRSRLEGAILLVVGGGVAAAIRALESATALEPALAGIYAVLVAWILLAPAAIGRLPVDALGPAADG